MEDQELTELRATVAALQERLATVEAELASTRVASGPTPVGHGRPGPDRGGEPSADDATPSPFGRRDLLRRGGIAAGAAVAGTAVAGVLTASPAAAATVSGNGNPGVLGTGAGGPGVVGTSATSAGVFGGSTAVGFGGVQGEVALAGVYGVVGKHGDGGVGVFGSSAGSSTANSVGVLGTADVDAGTGVRGTSASANATGVNGDTTGDNGIGVAGTGTGLRGTGVSGLSVTGYGGVFQGGGSASGAALFVSPLGTDPPARTGDHFRGELIADATGALWFCTASGAPGTWRQLAADDSAGTLHLLANPPRIYDSRLPGFGGKFTDKTERTIDATKRTNGTGSGVPAGAIGVLVNLVATNTNPGGFAALWASGLYPGNASLNWGSANMTIGNGTTTAMAPAGTFRCRVEGSADIIIDVVGYYR